MKPGKVYLTNGYHLFREFQEVRRRIGGIRVNQVRITTCVSALGQSCGMKPKKIYVDKSQIISYPEEAGGEAQ